MKKDEIIAIFEEHGVLQRGHFLLSSGLHSDQYLQCARIFEYPLVAETLCAELISKMKDLNVDMVLGPAVGAIDMAYEMSRQMGVPNIFAERVDGTLKLRRGFSIPEGANVLLVEDVVTTGGSVRELFPVVAEAGATVAAVGSIVDRSGGEVSFDVPFYSVLEADVTTYTKEECPLCAEGRELDEPGSRRLR